MPALVDWFQRVAAVAALLTALGTVGALWFTRQSLDHTAETTDATRRQVEVAEKGQVTDRYIRATDQLGSGVRLGAIHAFARLMDDSKPDIPTIVEVLAAYVREHAPRARPGPTPSPLPEGCPEKTAKPTRTLAADVQAALTAIGRRPVDPGLPPARIDLTGVDLTGADLVRLHLNGAQLSSADLSSANLFEAHLEQAVLRNARLTHATLRHAHLSGADLSGADLSDADLSDANLEEVDATTAFFPDATMPRVRLSHAVLNRTDFVLANLCWASLGSATLTATNFTAANLTETYLVDARFDNTQLMGADLTRRGPNQAAARKGGHRPANPAPRRPTVRMTSVSRRPGQPRSYRESRPALSDFGVPSESAGPTPIRSPSFSRLSAGRRGLVRRTAGDATHGSGRSAGTRAPGSFPAIASRPPRPAECGWPGTHRSDRRAPVRTVAIRSRRSARTSSSEGRASRSRGIPGRPASRPTASLAGSAACSPRLGPQPPLDIQVRRSLACPPK
ncbi:pentapeptide repeat-containing protein [Micromonospora sp. NPDC126480]|uniref:pentapeptide repeat-containing protein n=1 Tax=Micromonospora sp. NPDC126480 TaxID=3155312 RepID=UPI00331C8701